jgi:hypothetical protein
MEASHAMSTTRRVLLLFVALAIATAGALPSQAGAAPSRKKAIWGPAQVNGVSQFPIYSELGAGIYETYLRWNDVALSRPARATDPADPAYQWPAELDFVMQEAARYGIRVCLQVFGSPTWANGGNPANWVPKKVSDLADFTTAAARRYPDVHLWMIWGEPSRKVNFMPLVGERRAKPLNARQAAAPRYYARMLDASYGALKGVSSLNTVIGGNTFTVGDISPYNWIRYMRLPNGKPPRMDLYGHNPFSARKPDLRNPPPAGQDVNYADFSDLDTLVGVLDRYQRRGRARLKLFLSEFFFPTDHANWEFPFHVSRSLQAKWLADALRITRRWSRIYTLGWFSLYDDPPRPKGDEVNRGLIDLRDRRKPAFDAFKNG